MASICCSPPDSVPALLRLTLLEPWEESVDPFVVGEDRRLVGARERAHLQVLVDRHPAEDPTTFRRLADPELDDLVRLPVIDPLAAEGDLALPRPEEPGDRPKRRRLAGTVRSDERDDLTLVDRERHATQRMDRPVEGVDVGQFQQRHRSGLRRAAAEVCLDDLRVRADVDWRPLGDDLAVVEDGHPVADAHDHPHVVLDEQDGQAELGAQAPDEVGHLAGLARVHAGRGLIEQQQLRARAEGTGDLEAALIAVRQVAGPRVRSSFQPDQFEEPHALVDRRLLLVEHRRGPQDRVPPVTPEVDVDAGPHVVEGRHRPEQPDVLERPPDAQGGHFVRLACAQLPALATDELVAVERDLPLGRRIGAGDHVEERRLAGPVRPDQRDDRGARDVEVDAVDGEQASEALGDTSCPDQELVVRDRAGQPDGHRAGGHRSSRSDGSSASRSSSAWPGGATETLSVSTSTPISASASCRPCKLSSAARWRLGRKPSGRNRIITTSRTPKIRKLNCEGFGNSGTTAWNRWPSQIRNVLSM